MSAARGVLVDETPMVPAFDVNKTYSPEETAELLAECERACERGRELTQSGYERVSVAVRALGAE